MSNPFSQTPPASLAGNLDQAERVSTFLTRVYGWMFLGLAITGAVAYAVAGSPTLIQALVSNRLLFWLVLLAPIGFVWALSAKVDSLSPGQAAALFATYAALNGVTFAFILLVYTGESVATTFLTSAGAFGGLALYGTVTKRNLEGVGQFAMMGLFGLLIAMLVGFFWHSDTLQFVISVVGVIVFTCLTAYRAQQLRAMALALPEGQLGSYAVVGALGLYLAFVNLFLFLLRFMGRSRN
jgi:FtsH-binding integral membrane protein